jgi:hypothetical protein
VARKSIQGVVWIPKRLPAITPTRISIRATEIPTRMEIRLAARASAIHALAMSQTFDSTTLSGGARARHTKNSCPAGGPSRSHQPRSG